MAALRCPLGPHALGVRDVEGHVGHCCSACGGAWLPGSFLATIGQSRNFSAQRFAEMLRTLPVRHTQLACPQGCGELFCSEIKGVALDWCPACGGVWFDHGEVARLLAQYPRLAQAKKEVDGPDLSDVADIADALFSLLDIF